MNFTAAEGCGLQKFVGLNADLSFEAKKLARMDFPNVLTIQRPWGAKSGECEDRRLRGDRRGLAASSAIGRMWEGTITRSFCADGGYPGYDFGRMQLQLVKEDGIATYYMGVVNLDKNSGLASKDGGGQCSITLKYESDGFALQPVTDASFFAECGQVSFYDLRFVLSGGGVGTKISGNSDNWCHVLDLDLIDPVTSGSLV
mmetsp:Transcript_47952/g.89787  ORF Transcript_47952/g.89787 Transcript_47952/m.89787 type:complete len:201 (-) Transcript_47952:151-753(-)